MKISQTRLIIGGLIVGLALVAAFASFFVTPPKLGDKTVDEVFAEAPQNPNFVQVSVYGIESVINGRLRGNGHVRYNRSGQIFGYGDGAFGAHITVIFNDPTSKNVKTCLDLLSQPIPFKKELFISGNGSAGTNGIKNPITGVIASPNIIQYQDISACALTDQR